MPPKRLATTPSHSGQLITRSALIPTVVSEPDPARAELVSGAVHPQRIVAKGLGAPPAVADNATASGRQQNRRIEVVISDMDGTFAKSR